MNIQGNRTFFNERLMPTTSRVRSRENIDINECWMGDEMHKTLNNLAIQPQNYIVTRNKRPAYESRHSPDLSRLSKYSNLDAWDTNKGT